MGNLLQRTQRQIEQQPVTFSDQEIESLKEKNCYKATEIIQHFKDTFQDTVQDETQPITIYLYSEAYKDQNTLHTIKSINNSTIKSYSIPDDISSQFITEDPFDDNQDLNIDRIVIKNDDTQEAYVAQFLEGPNHTFNLENVFCNSEKCNCNFQDGTKKTQLLVNPKNVKVATKTG